LLFEISKDEIAEFKDEDTESDKAANHFKIK
jgi:hypothetical protein